MIALVSQACASHNYWFILLCSSCLSWKIELHYWNVISWLIFGSITAYWLSNAVWASEQINWAGFSLWGSWVHCGRRDDIHAILGMKVFLLPLLIGIISIYCLSVFWIFDIWSINSYFFLNVDDGESALTRRRLCNPKKCDPSKGKICQIATSYKGLLGYFQSKSNVSDTCLCIYFLCLVSE